MLSDRKISLLARLFTLPLLSGLCLFESGCHRAEKKAKAEAMEKLRTEAEAVAKIIRALEVGESVVFAFPPDGNWHPSPYVALRDHHIRLVAHGATINQGDNIIEFRLGTLKQVMTSRSDFTVSGGGPIFFRLSPHKLRLPLAQAEVQITRLK